MARTFKISETMALRSGDLVRKITDEEIDFYADHGWVFLKQLVRPDVAEEMLRTAHKWQALNKQTIKADGLATKFGLEPFRSITFSDVLVQNVKQLMWRSRLSLADVPVRFRSDHFQVKPPGGIGVAYHQDSSEHGTDRTGELQFWLALAEATPEMGTMRFVSGSHKEGPLGSILGKFEDRDLLSIYPKLTTIYNFTEPMHYHLGDATVHHGYTVHGSGANLSDRSRLSYILSYAPADALYWDGLASGNPGSMRIPPDDAQFPIVG